MSLQVPTTQPLVVGAGFLGRMVAEGFGKTIHATTRSGTWGGQANLPSHVELHRLDVLHDPPGYIHELLRPATCLVICFAPGREQPRRGLYLSGTHKLLQAAREAPQLRRVVYTSSTSALATRDGLLADDDPTWPTTERGQVQREAEQQVAQLCSDAKLPYFVLRLGGLYGPGRGIGRIYRNRKPGTPLAGDGSAPTNLIHRDDAATCIWAAMAAPAELAGVINVCADDHRSRRELYAAAAKHRGDPPPQWELPAAPEGKTSGKTVDNRRMKAWLGVTLRYPSHVFDTEPPATVGSSSH